MITVVPEPKVRGQLGSNSQVFQIKIRRWLSYLNDFRFSYAVARDLPFTTIKAMENTIKSGNANILIGPSSEMKILGPSTIIHTLMFQPAASRQS